MALSPLIGEKRQGDESYSVGMRALTARCWLCTGCELSVAQTRLAFHWLRVLRIGIPS